LEEEERGWGEFIDTIDTIPSENNTNFFVSGKEMLIYWD